MFKFSGTTPEHRLLLIIVRREVPTVGKTSLNSRGGTASFGEPEGLSWPTVSCKQDRVTGSNWSKTAEQVKEIEES